MNDRDTEPEAPDEEASDDGAGTASEPDVSNPAELIRLVNMFQALMVDVRDIELDEAGRKRLFEIHRSAVDSLKALLSDDLEEELENLGLPIEDTDATAPELRIAQAQLVGWLNGLFQGMQAAVMAQQMGSAQQMKQLQQQRPELAESRSGGPYL